MPQQQLIVCLFYRHTVGHSTSIVADLDSRQSFSSDLNNSWKRCWLDMWCIALCINGLLCSRAFNDAHYRRPLHSHFLQAANALWGQSPPAQQSLKKSIHSKRKVHDEAQMREGKRTFEEKMLEEKRWCKRWWLRVQHLRVDIENKTQMTDEFRSASIALTNMRYQNNKISGDEEWFTLLVASMFAPFSSSDDTIS